MHVDVVRLRILLKDHGINCFQSGIECFHNAMHSIHYAAL